VGHDIVRELAPRVEAAGFRTLWFNHAGPGNALASMQVAASVTSTLRLGSGVVAVDRMPGSYVVREVRERELPLDRCILGIGASAKPSPLTTVRDATELLHGELSATVYVGALGPKMRRLAVTVADGELLNWLTPDAARLAMQEKDADIAAAMKTGEADVSLYIRVAMGEASRPILEREAARYAGIPAYAANFARLGITALEASVYGESPEEVRAGLDRYTGVVDEAVVRAITPNDALDEFIALVDAVAG
ncbi:MAG TPA: LLM class flavin-dependent oxidoreductase, partial [Thermomicrobiales bacterium]|nr:LLM class flavin-dependent oxidoreductase [Thermomicrobiales bacterium]